MCTGGELRSMAPLTHLVLGRKGGGAGKGVCLRPSFPSSSSSSLLLSLSLSLIIIISINISIIIISILVMVMVVVVVRLYMTDATTVTFLDGCCARRGSVCLFFFFFNHYHLSRASSFYNHYSRIYLDNFIFSLLNYSITN